MKTFFLMLIATIIGSLIAMYIALKYAQKTVASSPTGQAIATGETTVQTIQSLFS